MTDELPNGYEIKERHKTHGTEYYWVFAGGELWSDDYVSPARAARNAVRHSKLPEALRQVWGES